MSKKESYYQKLSEVNKDDFHAFKKELFIENSKSGQYDSSELILKKYSHKGLLYLEVISSTDNSIPCVNKHKKFVIRLLRDLYAIAILFFILFGFLSFYLLKKDINKNLIAWIEISTFFVAVADLVAHWVASPMKDNKHYALWKSYLLFMVSPVFWILLLMILPSLNVINVLRGTQYGALETFSAFKFIRIIRLLMLLNIFSSTKRIGVSLINDKVLIFNVMLFIIILINLFALTVWYTENKYMEDLVAARKYPSLDKAYEDNPNVIRTYWDALYFSAITLTTIGYGDFVPKSNYTKMIVPIISIVGIAIIATPGGVIAASILSGFQKTNIDDRTKEQEELAAMLQDKIETRAKIMAEQIVQEQLSNRKK